MCNGYDQEPTLFLEPVTKRISQEQLRVELRSICSGLIMVENKCKDVDREQTRLAIEGDLNCRPELSPKQWQALIALHKTLLHEFHDFFLASQHPAATPNLIKLAARNSMPARLWQFGIHNFLEVLRFHLPESLDYMLAFIYTAYSMMTLLYETVPAFADTWIECLGDLGRYRMAVEDDDRRATETWSGGSRYWYTKAWDKKPDVGRLAYHMAILSRPFAFEQLSLYLHALTSITPLESARTARRYVITTSMLRFDLSHICSVPRGRKSRVTAPTYLPTRPSGASGKVSQLIAVVLSLVADDFLPWLLSGTGANVASLAHQLRVSRLWEIWTTFIPASMLFTVIPMTSAAPINGDQPGIHASSNGLSITDYITFAIGMALMVCLRLLSSCLKVNKADLSLCLSAFEGFTWWATKSDDRTSPAFLAVYVQYLGRRSWRLWNNPTEGCSFPSSTFVGKTMGPYTCDCDSLK